MPSIGKELSSIVWLNPGQTNNSEIMLNFEFSGDPYHYSEIVDLESHSRSKNIIWKLS